jgi:hypothetical protein
MLELARRYMGSTTVRVLDDELKVAKFMELTKEDITGVGRLKPVAARHFAEKAQRIQDISAFFESPVGQDPAVRVHFSSIKLAKLLEDQLDLEQFELVTPYIRITEEADAQRMMAAAQEQAMMDVQTPSGFMPGDSDPDALSQTQGAPNDLAQGPAGPGGPPGAAPQFGQ